MDIAKMELLIEAVKLKSFSKVAEKHAYTPSALSHIVDAIENELGIKILQRDYSGVKLSTDGEKVFGMLEELVQKSNQIKEYSLSLSKKQNRFVLGCYSSVSHSLLPELLLRFKQVYPEVIVNVVVGDELEEMKRKKAEIYIVDRVESNEKAFIPIYLGKYVVVAKEGLFENKKTFTKQDLNKYPFLMPNVSVVKDVFCDLECEIIDVLSSDDSSILSMVKKGLGVSVLPELSVKNFGKGIKSYKLEPEITRELGIVVDSEITNPAVKNFIRFISK